MENFEGVLSLWFSNCNNFVDFSLSEGLKKVKEIRNFWIVKNNNLINFKGLENLKSINWQFHVTANNKLKDFSGLDNVKYTGLQFRVGFRKIWAEFDDAGNSKRHEVEGNASLDNFCALSNAFVNTSDFNSNNNFIEKNLFNPTIEEIVTGNCKK